MSIEEQLKLLDKWFNGKIVIEISNKKECDDFINFIRTYDLRFSDNKHSYKNFPLYLVWRYSKELHRHQLEYSSIKEYFSGKLLAFGKIKDYIELKIEFSDWFFNPSKGEQDGDIR